MVNNQVWKLNIIHAEQPLNMYLNDNKSFTSPLMLV